jgi:hypothetical protein
VYISIHWCINSLPSPDVPPPSSTSTARLEAQIKQLTLHNLQLGRDNHALQVKVGTLETKMLQTDTKAWTAEAKQRTAEDALSMAKTEADIHHKQHERRVGGLFHMISQCVGYFPNPVFRLEFGANYGKLLPLQF